MDAKTKEFWEKYEEKHGKVDHEIYDLSGFVYGKNAHEKSQFIYKPYGTSHEMKFNNILSESLSVSTRNAINKTVFFFETI
jgi:hypothetical protein